VINRIGAFYLDMAKVEIEAGAGLLDGFVIWGDVAYKKCTSCRGLLAGIFQTLVAGMAEAAHAADLPVIYHGCGNVKAIFTDYIEMGLMPTTHSRRRRAWTWWNCAGNTAIASGFAATAIFKCGRAATRGRPA